MKAKQKAVIYARVSTDKILRKLNEYKRKIMLFSFLLLHLAQVGLD